LSGIADLAKARPGGRRLTWIPSWIASTTGRNGSHRRHSLGCEKGVRGTGIFITPEYAVTAFHNLPPRIAKTFPARYCGHDIEVERIDAWSSEAADIAVVRLVRKDPGVEVSCVSAAYFDPAMPLVERKRYWAGREVVLFGYPWRGEGRQIGLRVDGAFDTGHTPHLCATISGSSIPSQTTASSRKRALRFIKQGRAEWVERGVSIRFIDGHRKHVLAQQSANATRYWYERAVWSDFAPYAELANLPMVSTTARHSQFSAAVAETRNPEPHARPVLT
jgi:hypothetical protein